MSAVCFRTRLLALAFACRTRAFRRFSSCSSASAAASSAGSLVGTDTVAPHAFSELHPHRARPVSGT